MKIIFDSIEQKDKFFTELCPSEGLTTHRDCGSGRKGLCEECWEQCGLKYEIKGDQPIEEFRLNLNDIIRVKFTEYGKDIYYHQHDNLIDKFGCSMITRSYPKVDEEGYTDIQLWVFMQTFGPYIKFGMPERIIENNTIYIPKESMEMIDQPANKFTYTDAVYELVKEECEGLDSIYEDYIVKLVGNCGLAALKRANLIESCGVLNCRRLWVLCERQ